MNGLNFWGQGDLRILNTESMCMKYEINIYVNIVEVKFKLRVYWIEQIEDMYKMDELP